MPLHSAIAGAIQSCTGLSVRGAAAALFTVIALVAAAFHFVSAKLKRGPTGRAAAIGELTLKELAAFDGSDPEKPLLMAIRGQVFDVSKSRNLYGSGAPYALFAGKDASRALAIMSFDPNDVSGNVEGLDEAELEVLLDWECKFLEKYTRVGRVVIDMQK